MKTKIESHSDEATYFYSKEIVKANFNYTSLAVISLDSAVKKDENYYPQVFKIPNDWKKVVRQIIDDLERSSDDFDDSDGSDDK